MMIVTLTDKERRDAIQGGEDRYDRVIRQGLKFQEGQRSGRKGFHKQDHICGAVAEYAFYKMKGKIWSPTLDSVEHGDFDNIEIKATYRANGNLLIPKTYSGNYDLQFVLATVSNDNTSVNFIGWIPGKLAISEKYWADHMQRPCWFIPKGDLNDINIAG